MRITKADYNDLQDILDLQYLAYQSEARLYNDPNIPPLSQTLSDVETEFETGVFIKAVNEDGHIIGSVRAHSDNGTLYIGKLIVRPDLQGQGIGTELLKEIERICPHERYELFTGTKSALNIKLYERVGYVKFKEQTVSNDLIFVYLCKTKANKNKASSSVLI
ncbi:MAG: GNAT family N-acetyltransferase [Deltaproteobacteria bacterium]|jgi:GNAT superfamily N-acetyltransferase|nr:GNAT family N-acetyltransferase [Deltaproteobacteria bacterium]